MNLKKYKGLAYIVGVVAAALLYFPNMAQFNALASKVDCMKLKQDYKNSYDFYFTAKQAKDKAPKDQEALKDFEYWQNEKNLLFEQLKTCGKPKK